MSHGETNTRDQRVVGAYRAASEALDERPHVETRAAILAAAARAVDAQPQDAETGAMSRRKGQRARVRASSLGPSKRPLALVASFLVATVALVLATQTMQHQATDAPPAERNAVKVAEERPAPAAQARADQEHKMQRDENGQRMSLAKSTSEVTDKLDTAPAAGMVSKPARTKQEAPATAAPAAPPAESEQKISQRALADARERPSSLRAEGAASVERAAEPASAPIVAAAPSPPSVAAAPPASSVAAAPSSPEPQQPAKESANRALLARPEARAGAVEADATAQGKLVKAKPVQRTAAIAEDAVENDPARWMERIIALRDAGHDEDADRELARLRERYPDMKVPPNALRRAGTR